MGISNYSVSSKFTTKTAFIPINEIAALVTNGVFTLSMDASGTRAVVGTASVRQGRVYFYDGTAWALEATVSVDISGFGGTVAIDKSGTKIIVGAENSHRAYIYLRTGTVWSLEATLIASTGNTGNFGRRVNLDLGGNRAIVSAPFINKSFVFRCSSGVWTQEAILEPTPVSTPDNVLLNSTGDKALVAKGGTIIIFNRVGTSWATDGVITPSSTDGTFGIKMEADSTFSRLVVGTETTDRAYVFLQSGSTWTQEAILVSGAIPVSWFGRSVAINGDGSIIAVGDTHGTTSSGNRVYLFTRNGTIWTQVAALVSSEGAVNNFGAAVAMNGAGTVLAANNAGTNKTFFFV